MVEERDRSPQGRFRFLADKRVGKALTAIVSVGKLSDKKNYDYTNDQANQIIDALNDAVEQVRSDFARSQKQKAVDFKLR